MEKRTANRPTTTEVVAEMLREDIASGDLPPGTRLRQDRIAERLNVSITPVREAFALLRSDGLLTPDPHRGVEVKTPTPAELHELYEMRIALERLAIERAVPEMSDRVTAGLERMLERMVGSSGASYLELNRDFHLKLYEPAGLPRLQETISRLRASADLYLHVMDDAARLGDLRRSGDAQHAAIVEMCRAGDAERAADCLEDHLRHTLRFIDGFVGKVAAEAAPSA